MPTSDLDALLEQRVEQGPGHIERWLAAHQEEAEWAYTQVMVRGRPGAAVFQVLRTARGYPFSRQGLLSWAQREAERRGDERAENGPTGVS